MRDIFFRRLSRACRLYSVLCLLVKSSIVANAVLPILEVILEVIAKEVLTTKHLAVFPLRFISPSLNELLWYVWIDECAVPVELTFNEIAFVHHSICVCIASLTMVPAFFGLALVMASTPH